MLSMYFTGVFFLIFKKDFIYLFLEREREEEREGEKHHHVVGSRVPPTGDPAATQACALPGNQTSNPLVHRLALNPLSHTIQGFILIFIY